MKKIYILIICVVLLLAACDDNVYYWEFSHEVEYVKEIMIVEMHDEYDYSIIKEIDPEFSDELYSDVKALKMKKYGTNLASPDGLCIMIVFENGDFDVISKKESKHYKIVDDEVLAYNSWLCCDKSEFDALINKYSV